MRSHLPRSRTGLWFALLFFSASLQPSLLPRAWIVQSVVSGLLTAIGYALGAVLDWLVRYLEIPAIGSKPTRRVVSRASFIAVGALVLFSMWVHVGWQNDQRTIFDMPTVAWTVWLALLPATLVVASLLFLAARGLRWLALKAGALLTTFIPRRLAMLLGAVGVVAIIVLALNGVLLGWAGGVIDQAFSVRDRVTPSSAEQPASILRSGSPSSLVAWDSMGRQGKLFVSGGPTTSDLLEVNGVPGLQPIRVYAGLRSAESPTERAKLLLDELKRTDAFEREVVVLAVTTGTGFVDPMAADSLELMFNGDTAIAGIQYSYLPSWMSLVADEDASTEIARAVFDTVHSHWVTLPEDERPSLYLFGMSLGSFGVEEVLGSINLVNEPIDGALLAGPPFINELHREITVDRDQGSPEWLPVYRGGSTVRFMSTDTVPGGAWDGMRVLYLQHASDPMTFFSTDLAWSEPDWLRDGHRGPDVSQEMWWIPVVTMWQVAFDLPSTGLIPRGHGHLFTGSEYVDAWAEVTQVDGWTSERATKTKSWFDGED